jgi:DNA end-binding protein Ku
MSWKRSRSKASTRSRSTSSCRRRRSTSFTSTLPTSSRRTARLENKAFAVIREAIRKEGMVALARVVFTSREHIIALEPRGKGLIGTTLRYPYEVRNEEDYFDDIPNEKIPKDMLDLASHIVETKSGHFEPKEFQDQYEDALKELLKKKQKGQNIELPKQHAPSKVINLMDALRRSVEGERAGGEAHKGRHAASRKRAHKKTARSHPRKRAG